ncbi:MAG: DUF4350 domain-containing protein, partial [Bacteroidota bacterium]
MKPRNSFLFLLLFPALVFAQQYADSTYLAPTFTPRYTPGEGPTVFVDEAHNNFHTRDGRYSPFARVLERDGFKVVAFNRQFTAHNLAEVDILVIANALPPNTKKWQAPTLSAFHSDELQALEAWVSEGGRLFLLADHMPMAGAARELAAHFGFICHDGFADDPSTESGAEIFALKDGSLTEHELTLGAEGYFQVASVTTYTGQAFQLPEGAESILNCGPGWINKLPNIAWQFTENTPTFSVEGWSQLAILRHGKGKLVFSGEAAMFSAQIAIIGEHKIKAGMNGKKGKNNYKLLLNLLRWLA